MAQDASTPRSPNGIRWGVATLTPLAGVAVAYGLWWMSDRLIQIGPFDRATFGWVVVVPLWALTPAAAAFAWRGLTFRQSAITAVAVGGILASVAALLFWSANAFPDCEFGALRTPAEWILPSIAVGAVMGGGFAATCLACAALLREGRRGAAVLVGAATAFSLIFVTLAVMAMLLGIGSGVCQRPPLV
jgi:hypothetical protein